jgi:hypothetical protein
VIDQIVWVRASEEEGRVEDDSIHPARMVADSDQDLTQEKNLFVNMKSTCLVGYKCPLGNKAEYRTKVSNNIIFARAQKGCTKPAEIYEIADLMMPGAKKLEVGGASLKGWLSMKHHEYTLHRCGSCFKEERLYLEPHADAPVSCHKCIVERLASQLGSDASISDLNAIFRKTPKVQISEVLFLDNSPLVCSQCLQ